MEQEKPVLRILHFNDVYDIQPKEKTNKAGAYYFKYYLDKHRTQNTLTLFSGDAFSPSGLSNIFEGQQMVHCLNKMKIDVACYGNHQFDYDIDHTIDLASKCNFPWLLGNLIDLRTDRPLGNGLQNIIIEKNGLKIGIFGVAEEEWISLLRQDYQGQLQYKDFIKYSRYQVKQLRGIYKCDLVIALTHMRIPNDQILARQVPDIDLILGGHDHSVHNQMIGTVQIIKTGCNFNLLSVIDLYPKSVITPNQGKKFNQSLELVSIDPVQDYDKELKEYVDEKLKLYKEQSQKVVGYTLVELDTRFQIIRKKQTNYGNFLTDLIRAFYNIDAVIIQSGSIRSDCIFQPGPLKYSDISNLFDSYLIVKYIPGRIIHQTLQHSVSKYPSFQGRFLMVSGIRFTFDASKKQGQRIQKQSITMNGFPLDYDKVYKVGMGQYIAKGGDGYTFLTDCRQYIEAQNATKFISLLMRFYRPRDFNVASQQQIQVLQQQMKILSLTRATSSRSDRISKFINKVECIDGKYTIFIAPTIDGRISILNEV